MKVVPINEAALHKAIETLIGSDGLEIVQQLYRVIDNAMADGFKSGYETAEAIVSPIAFNAGFKAGDFQNTDEYDTGFEDGFSMAAQFADMPPIVPLSGPVDAVATPADIELLFPFPVDPKDAQ